MNNEHPGGGECRSPSPPRALRALPPGFPLLLFRPLHGAGPGPGARGASPRSATRPGCCPPLRSRATNAVCSRVAIRFAVAALARRSAALRRPRRSVGAALGFASRALALPLRPPRVAPPAAGPPLAPPARLSVPLAFRSAALAAFAGAPGVAPPRRGGSIRARWAGSRCSPAFSRSARAGPRRGAPTEGAGMIGRGRAGGLPPALALARRYTKRRVALGGPANARPAGIHAARLSAPASPRATRRTACRPKRTGALLPALRGVGPPEPCLYHDSGP